jgi:hypothetical protein
VLPFYPKMAIEVTLVGKYPQGYALKEKAMM